MVVWFTYFVLHCIHVGLYHFIVVIVCLFISTVNRFSTELNRQVTTNKESNKKCNIRVSRLVCGVARSTHAY